MYSKNVMWTKIETPIITSSVALSEITFKHMFAQVEWTITSTAGEISESQVALTPTFEQADVHMGDLISIDINDRIEPWTGIGTPNFGTPIEMATSATEGDYNIVVTSKLTTFCPAETKDAMAIKIAKMTIDSRVFTDKEIKFNKSLQRGVRYKIASTIKRQCEVIFESSNFAYGTVVDKGSQFVTSWGETLSSTPQPFNGYLFEGWYSSKDLYLTKLTNSDNFKIDDGGKLTVTVNKDTEGQIYMANFVPVPVLYTVTFSKVSLLGGIGSITQEGIFSGSSGEMISSTAKANQGYIFYGWFDAPDLSVAEKVEAGETLTVAYGPETDGKTYYAVFISRIE